MLTTCDEIRLLMPDALTGRLEAHETAALETHLDACADCRAHFAQLRRTAAVLNRAYPKSNDTEEGWARFEGSAGVPPATESPKPFVLSRWAFAAAAVLLCAVLVARYWGSSADRPDQDIAQTPPTSETEKKEGNQETPESVRVAQQQPLPEAPATPEVADALPDVDDEWEPETPNVAKDATNVPGDALPEPVVTNEARASIERPGDRAQGLPARGTSTVEVQDRGRPRPQAEDSTTEAAGTAAVHSGRPPREPISDAQGLIVLRRTGALVVYEPEHRIWRTLQSGEAVPYGARVRTGADAQAELAFGESRLWLDAASDLVVARADDGSRRAELDHGRLRVDLLRPDAAFSVGAGGGSVELTGTIIEVEAAAPQLAFVRTLEGHIRVRPGGAAVAQEPFEVTAGQEALLAMPGRDEPLSTLSPSLRDRAQALARAPGGQLAFKAEGDDWTKTLTQPPPKSRAVGQLLVTDTQGRPAEPLHIARLAVEARIRGAAALTRVDQSFRNDTDRTLEGTFYFPLPPGAALSRFAMYVDNEQKTLIEGEVVEREYARSVYESILHQKRDPALVEWMEGNLFKARIFPIPPHSLKRVILEYTQLLPATFDTRRYVFPLVSELTRTTPIDAFSFHAVLETGDGTSFRRIVSPSYPEVGVRGTGRPRAFAELALNDLKPTADFVLSFTAPRSDELIGDVYAESGEAPYLLLGYQPRPGPRASRPQAEDTASKAAETRLRTASPGKLAAVQGPRASRPQQAAVQDRDILFVVETSGARTPDDLDTQAHVLRAVLAGLDPDRDRVALAAADVGFTLLTEGWSNTYANAFIDAQATLDRRAPLGALDLGNVLSGAARYVARDRNEARERLVVFIGSGVPALGVLDPASLADRAVEELRGAGARFAGFAVGRTVDVLALGALARRTDGLYLPLKGDEDITETAFLAALSLQTPWLESPALSTDGVTLTDVRPAELGSLLPGQEVFMHARLVERPRAFAVTVTGRLNGNPYSSRTTVALPLHLNANPALGRFWARAHLDHLLAAPQTQQIRRQVIDLAKTWTLMTPYTSFLVLESEQDYARYGIQREQRRRIWREDAEAFDESEVEDVSAQMRQETPEQRADRLLREARQITGIQDQARLAEAKAESETGLSLYRRMDYAAAKRHLERSAELDPTNLQTIENLRKVDAMLGLRRDQFQERLAQLEQDQRVRIQEQVGVLSAAMDEARKLERRGDEVDLAVADAGKEQILADQLDNLRQAEIRYRRTKEILNYLPPTFDLPNERTAAEESIQRIREKIAAKEDEISFLRRQEAARISEEQSLRETVLFKQRIQKLKEQVHDLHDKGEYRSAEKLAIRILQLDPLNEDAERLKRNARAAQHLAVGAAPSVAAPTPAPKSGQTISAQLQQPKETAPVATGAPNLDRPTVPESKPVANRPPTEPVQSKVADNTTQVPHHLAGERLFKAFEYRTAQAELQQAVRDDPTDEASRELLIQVNDILNARQDRIRAGVESLAQSQRVAVQERLVLLDDRLDWGNRYAAKALQDPDLDIVERIRQNELALDAFERARELIKWMPVGVQMDEQQHQAERMIAETRRTIKALEVQLAEEDKQKAMELSQRRATREREGQERRVAMQLDEVKALFEIGEYERAEEAAGKVLETDPANPEAHTLQIAARDRKYIQRQKWIQEEYDEEFSRQKELADKNYIPHQDYLVYPDNWPEIPKRSAGANYYIKDPNSRPSESGTIGDANGARNDAPQDSRAVSQQDVDSLRRQIEDLRTQQRQSKDTAAELGSEEILQQYIRRSKAGAMVQADGHAAPSGSPMENAPRRNDALFASSTPDWGSSNGRRLKSADVRATIPSGEGERTSPSQPVTANDEEVEKSHMPYGDLLLYPSNWDEISRRPEALANARREKEELEKDLSEQKERIDQAIRSGVPRELFYGPDLDGASRTVVDDPEIARGELGEVLREKQRLERTLDEQTQRITRAIQNGVPMEIFYGQDPEFSQPPLPDARVLAIRPELDLVMLSIGEKDGVKPGYRMTISRGSDYLAKAEIQKVYPEMGSARLFLKKGEVRVNDSATSRVPRTSVAKDGPAEARAQRDSSEREQQAHTILNGEDAVGPGRRAEPAERSEEDKIRSAIRRGLSRHVSFEFVDTPLQEAITFLQTLSKQNIILDPRAATAGAAQLKITLRVTDMDMETALKWILRLAELDYTIRDRSIFISTRTLLSSNVELEIYDVADLTGSITEYPGVRIEDVAHDGQSEQYSATSTSVKNPDLAQVIRERLPKEFADPTTSVEGQGGKLVVMQRPEVHAKIRSILQGLREDAAQGRPESRPVQGETGDPPAPPAGTDGAKGDQKEHPAEDSMTIARKHLQDALAALPRSDETARQRLRLYAELVDLSRGADVYRAMNDGIADFGGGGPFAEALAKLFLRRLQAEQDQAVLEAAMEFTSDPALRAHLAARCGSVTDNPERRIGFFAQAYEQSPAFLHGYVQALSASGKSREVIAVLEGALRKGAKDAWITVELQKWYRQAQNDEGQLRVLTQAVAVRPREAEPRRQLARALDEMGRGAEALRELRLARDFRSEDLADHREYLTMAERLKDVDAMQDALLGILKRDWSDPSVHPDAIHRLKELVANYQRSGEEAKAKGVETRLAEAAATDLYVRLTWDTNSTDVDLHVIEPSGHETYYQSMRSETSQLDRDVTSGRGPETYTVRHARPGHYAIAVKYYRGGKKTNATVVVTRRKDAPEEETRTFSVPLESEGTVVKVFEFDWP